MELDEETKAKLAKYEKMIADRRRGAEITNNVPAEVRKARAKKAVEARWKKYRKEKN